MNKVVTRRLLTQASDARTRIAIVVLQTPLAQFTRIAITATTIDIGLVSPFFSIITRIRIVDPAIVYGVALRHRAMAIVVAHNHPSGDPEPSRHDIEVTLRLAEAGRVLGVPLLDHVVIARGGYRSLAEVADLAGFVDKCVALPF